MCAHYSLVCMCTPCSKPHPPAIWRSRSRVVVTSYQVLTGSGTGAVHTHGPHIHVRVASRNRTLAHIRRFEKMADEVGATENRLCWFTWGVSDILLGGRLCNIHYLFHCRQKGRTEMPSLTNLGRFSRVRLFDYDVFDRIVYLQLPRANGPLRVLLHTFAQY